MNDIFSGSNFGKILISQLQNYDNEVVKKTKFNAFFGLFHTFFEDTIY